MLIRLRHPLAVWALALCLVLVNGSMAAPSVVHAEHHGAHKAGTHTTGICAWLCAAGQAVESSSVNFDSTLQLVGLARTVSADPLFLLFAPDLFPRGPPVFSL